VLGAGSRRTKAFVVDTHVQRITTLLGLTKEKDPVKIERDRWGPCRAKKWGWFSTP